jgi:hypothetical protein
MRRGKEEMDPVDLGLGKMRVIAPTP